MDMFVIDLDKLENHKEPDTILEFTLFVWDRTIFYNKKQIPLGQCTTDILNLDIEYVKYMLTCNKKFADAVDELFDSKMTLEKVTRIQNTVNNSLDILVSLPPFKYLLKPDYAHKVLIDLYNDDNNYFKELGETKDKRFDFLYGFFERIFKTINSYISFRTYISTMLEHSFENLKNRNTEQYSFAVHNFFSNQEIMTTIRFLFPEADEFNFNQATPNGVRYVPARNPNNKNEYIIIEKLIYTDVSGFLHTDFFRALMVGHCPRKCHNCGKYFLLLSGHNTCYCSNPLPNQTTKGKIKTCRDVGAHNKEREQKENRTPAQVEYDKVYNRLKTRKNRKKISEEDWLKQTNLAWEYKLKNENGELSDFEYKELMSKF